MEIELLTETERKQTNRLTDTWTETKNRLKKWKSAFITKTQAYLKWLPSLIFTGYKSPFGWHFESIARQWHFLFKLNGKICFAYHWRQETGKSGMCQGQIWAEPDVAGFNKNPIRLHITVDIWVRLEFGHHHRRVGRNMRRLTGQGRLFLQVWLGSSKEADFDFWNW